MGGRSAASCYPCRLCDGAKEKNKSNDSGLFTGELKSLLFTTEFACLSPLRMYDGGTQQW